MKRLRFASAALGARYPRVREECCTHNVLRVRNGTILHAASIRIRE